MKTMKTKMLRAALPENVLSMSLQTNQKQHAWMQEKHPKTNLKPKYVTTHVAMPRPRARTGPGGSPGAGSSPSAAPSSSGAASGGAAAAVAPKGASPAALAENAEDKPSHLFFTPSFTPTNVYPTLFELTTKAMAHALLFLLIFGVSQNYNHGLTWLL